ncbi:hypothetical protein FRACYDRAFT_269151 [Fragilariopsis cylindrus CCMP1102]|uniref:Uncharacterized protein n=1 Tax=Fragilariopsis cylindrus CCMP1102 TaxID=635003 RepID=A0A1E7FFH9_9STRA|nr:hypothetical protein FRACYDRAFT_269151 [Fragilariopsis cylindrus CCMP1102]|eukprot:OEU16928.1 hypothetical protein FRACYDRAFT_269151 [Fragilariopsis cylindrus CCMP1102]
MGYKWYRYHYLNPACVGVRSKNRDHCHHPTCTRTDSDSTHIYISIFFFRSYKTQLLYSFIDCWTLLSFKRTTTIL